jgi:hypothetical protein
MRGATLEIGLVSSEVLETRVVVGDAEAFEMREVSPPSTYVREGHFWTARFCF